MPSLHVEYDRTDPAKTTCRITLDRSETEHELEFSKSDKEDIWTGSDKIKKSVITCSEKDLAETVSTYLMQNRAVQLLADLAAITLRSQIQQNRNSESCIFQISLKKEYLE